MSHDATFYMQLSAFLMLIVCALSGWITFTIWDRNKVFEELTSTLRLQNKKIRELQRQARNDYAAEKERDKKIIRELNETIEVNAWVIGKLRSQLKNNALDQEVHEDVISFEDSNLPIGTHALGLP